MAKKNIRNKEMLRHGFQLLWAAVNNGYIHGYLTGKIYKGKLKQICLPGLNCYSCVGSLGSCPIGSLQAVIGRKGKTFSFYVIGFLLMIGSVLGRFVCGWLCPFGFIQDLLNKIPFPRKVRFLPKEKLLVKTKYIILILFVLLLPIFFVNDIGNGAPAFCKWICPVGTLEGGIPLVASNEALQQQAGWLFIWKISLLAVILFTSIIVYRPFCKLFCPLGAIYSLFNKVTMYRYRVNMDVCIGCGKCKQACKMNVNPVQDANHLECIRCGNCKNACPVNAIESGFFKYAPKENKYDAFSESNNITDVDNL